MYFIISLIYLSKLFNKEIQAFSMRLNNFFFVARFFKDCISEEDFNELNIEVIRNTLYKSYLEQFYDFCEACGGATAEVMCEILAVCLLYLFLSKDVMTSVV